jgi:type I restriction enzyme S subunit
MNENRKIPELRFPEYTDDWKDYRIGELFDERREKMPDGELLSVTIKDGIKKHSESGRRDSSSDDKSNYKKVCVGDIAYNSMRMWQGASGFSEYEGIISPAYTVIKPKENVDARCAAYLFKRKKMTNIFQRHSQGVASDTWNLKYPELSQIHIMFPRNVAEQHRISSFFSKIDSVIVLQQQYVDQLKEFKKGCLQKMFPKKGEKVPEMRFPGFTDDWEQRKLYEVADFNPKSELPETFEYVDLESVVGTEMISHRTESRDTAPSRAQRLAQTGDVFFQTVRPYQRNNYLFAKPDNNYVFSTGYAQMRPKIDAEFLMCFLQTDSFVKVVLDNCTGTSYPAINSNDLSNLEISLPVSADEQREIGRFVTNLDNLITLHQRKLDEMKEFKKGCLQKMFV